MARRTGASTVLQGVDELTDQEFERFRELIHRESGISLHDGKRALLVGRLSRRIRELGLRSFHEYHRYITHEDPGEVTQLLNRVSTNETHFFREPGHWRFLEHTLIPEWRAAASRGERRKHVRVWSAACSTGEEPYSLAMLLLAHLPPDEGWEVEIVATDISTRVLERAKQALWPIEKASEIAEPLRKRFLLRGTGDNAKWMKGSAELRNAIQFAHLNLCAPPYAIPGRFDAIFCRNVLIYFDQPTKQRVVNGLIERLQGDGCFFVGHAETLTSMNTPLKVVEPTIYRARVPMQPRTTEGSA